MATDTGRTAIPRTHTEEFTRMNVQQTTADNADRLDFAARVYVVGLYRFDDGAEPADALKLKGIATARLLDAVEAFPAVMLPGPSAWVPWEEDEGPGPEGTTA